MARFFSLLLVLCLVGCKTTIVKVDFRQGSVAYDLADQKLLISVHTSGMHNSTFCNLNLLEVIVDHGIGVLIGIGIMFGMLIFVVICYNIGWYIVEGIFKLIDAYKKKKENRRR